jgi:O-antigen ligase
VTTAAGPVAGARPDALAGVRGALAASSALPAQQWLALAAVATLPFAYALTLNLRFPFKLYELALVLCGAAVCVGGTLRAAPGTWRVLRPLWLYMLFTAAVLAARIARPLPTLNVATLTTRFGPAGDGITKLVYVGFALFGLIACSYAAYRDERLYVRVWLAGTAACAAYTWLLFGSSVIGAPAPLLLGMETPHYLHVAGRVIIRSGTFQEGNHLGLYLVCSTAVALYARRYLAAVLISLTTFTTFSTANVLGLAVLWLGTGWSAATQRRRGAGRVGAAVVYSLVAAVLVAALASTGYVAEVVFAKLGNADSVSKLDRLDLTIAGLRMAMDHPLAGVGLSQYGYHYRTYQLTTLFGQGDRIKGFPNNVYVELLSETGLVGTLLIGLFLLAVLRRTRAPEMASLRWGMLALLLVFGTFPTYTVMFLWAYWALILAAATRHGRPAAEPAR